MAQGEGSESSEQYKECFSSEENCFIYSINQFMMYEVVRRHKDNERGQLVITSELLREILQIAGLEDVDLSDRITATLKTKVSRLFQQATVANKKGGSTLKRLISKWKDGEPYKFKVLYSESSTMRLKEENEKLKREKRRLEGGLAEAAIKTTKLEEEVVKIQNSSEYWKNRFQSLVRKALNEKRKGVRGKQANKSFSDYSSRSRRRIRQEIKSDCQIALEFLGVYDLIPTKIEYFNANENVYETIDLFFDEECVLAESNSDANDDMLDDIYMLLFIKEKFQISDKAWHELSLKSKDLPSNYTLKQRMERLNKLWDVSPTPGNSEGVQMSLKSSLEEQLTRLVNDQKLEDTDNISIKLSGDGTRVGKRLQLLIVSYTIINEGSVAMTAKGNYVIAIIKTKDDYEGIKESLSDLREEMKAQDCLCIAGKNFKLTFFLGGDWKFLATVCGLGPANQNYACIWCCCPKNQRHDVSKKWSLVDEKLGARTIESIKHNVKCKKFNCQRMPLFSFIPMHYVIIDTLHLFLRISDILIANFVMQLKQEDAIRKDTFQSGFTASKYKHLTAFQDFLNSIGIPFKWNVDIHSKLLNYRELNGPEKLLLLEKISIPELFPHLKDGRLIQDLWSSFLEIYVRMRETFYSEAEIELYAEKIKKWIEDFLYLYRTSDVTPYMHAMLQHVPEFLKLYGNVALFNQQGLEKCNDQASKDYFRATNHRNNEALRQMLLKRNRIQYLEVNGAERVKKSYLCGNCKKSGHTIKKCTEKCSVCQANTCCAHLSKINGKWIRNCCLRNE